MSYPKIYQRLTLALAFLLGAGFFVIAYNAINNIVAEQSRLQQQALSPVYRLVRDELLRPLYIAETFASAVDFTTLIDSPQIDEETLLQHLAKLEKDLDLVFFVASERARKQYFSDGRTLDLIEGEVRWYFEARDQDRDIMADLGQVGDVHLYFDVKIYAGDGAFLGYVGVGKRIQRFLDTFDQYRSQYGYDFLFVNDRREIILSSLADLVVTNEYIPTLESLAWFDRDSLSRGSLDSELIELDGDDFLVSEIGIEELGWQLLLLVPLEARQAKITTSFVKNALAALAVVALFIGAMLVLMLFYKRSVEKRNEVDALCGLPNRRFMERRYRELQRANSLLCVILIDLDHFKQINDRYGHNVGDQVIREAATALKRDLREVDVVGRWGGEEFLMLVPASSIAMGETVAERARANLEKLRIETPKGSLAITASLGVAFGSSTATAFAALLSNADTALYAAKNAGRNQVRLHV